MGIFLSSRIFPVIVSMSVNGSVVILFVLLTRLLLRPAPKGYSYVLWCVVLFRLLCPASFTADFSILSLADAPLAEAAAATYTGLVPHNAGAVQREILGWLWLSGVAVLILHSLFSLTRVRRRLIGAARLRENIFLADHIDTPFVLGVVRPGIYLPSILEEREQEHIILHEQYHIRRLDHITRILAFGALCVHWFNPLVWLAFWLSEQDMEMSCDEAVIKRLGDGIRADYSASLLNLAAGRRIPAGTPLAFGEGDTRGRIRNLLNWKKTRTWIKVVSALLCVGVIAACAANPGNAETLDRPETESSSPAASAIIVCAEGAHQMETAAIQRQVGQENRNCTHGCVGFVDIRRQYLSGEETRCVVCGEASLKGAELWWDDWTCAGRPK